MRLVAAGLICIGVGAAKSPGDCVPCHRKQTEAIANTGMSKALAHPATTTRMTGSIGGYKYEVEGSSYTVSDGAETLRIPIAWTFGSGATEQTYAFERGPLV